MTMILDGNGIVTAGGTASTQGKVVLGEQTGSGTNTVTIQAASSMAADYTLTLPTADGTSGQVLQTNGSGALSFATPNSGNWVLISSATASASSSIQFTNLDWTTYKAFAIMMNRSIPGTNNQIMGFQLSTDNGSTYLTASNYYGSGFCAASTGTWGTNIFNFGPDNMFKFWYVQSSQGGMSGMIYLPESASNQPVYYANGFTTESVQAGTGPWASAGFYNNSSLTYNAVRLMFTSGNIASGKFYLYGIKG